MQSQTSHALAGMKQVIEVSRSLYYMEIYLILEIPVVLAGRRYFTVHEYSNVARVNIVTDTRSVAEELVLLFLCSLCRSIGERFQQRTGGTSCCGSCTAVCCWPPSALCIQN